MRPGVYVLDYMGGYFAILAGADIEAVLEEAPGIIRGYEREDPPEYDGSYHYYPILDGEGEHEAELRVYMKYAKMYGPGALFGRAAVLESLARGTWTDFGGLTALAASGPSTTTGEQFSLSLE